MSGTAFSEFPHPWVTRDLTRVVRTLLVTVIATSNSAIERRAAMTGGDDDKMLVGRTWCNRPTTYPSPTESSPWSRDRSSNRQSPIKRAAARHVVPANRCYMFPELFYPRDMYSTGIRFETLACIVLSALYIFVKRFTVGTTYKSQDLNRVQHLRTGSAETRVGKIPHFWIKFMSVKISVLRKKKSRQKVVPYIKIVKIKRHFFLPIYSSIESVF